MNSQSLILLLAQDNRAPDALAGVFSLFCMCIAFIPAIVIIAGMWKTFEKAGKPGWAAIIPVYNMIVLCEIAGKPIWWVLLLFIPCVGIVFGILIFIDVAKAFGQGAGFGVGLALLGFIFFPILGFGSARYVGVPQQY